MIGSDLETGAERMTWGIPEMSDGIGFVVVGMGMFGFGEILRNLEAAGSREIIQSQGDRPDADPAGPQGGGRRHRPRHGDRLTARHSAGRRRHHRVVRRATLWKRECRRTRRSSAVAPIEGVAAPESANNAAAQTSFIPLLTLGIPPNPVMALMVGAMTIHGIVRARRS